MSPRGKDPFIPGPDARPRSKSSVNRAGALLSEFFFTPDPDDPQHPIYGNFDRDAVLDAMFAVTWWNSSTPAR